MQHKKYIPSMQEDLENLGFKPSQEIDFIQESLNIGRNNQLTRSLVEEMDGEWIRFGRKDLELLKTLNPEIKDQKVKLKIDKEEKSTGGFTTLHFSLEGIPLEAYLDTTYESGGAWSLDSKSRIKLGDKEEEFASLAWKVGQKFISLPPREKWKLEKEFDEVLNGKDIEKLKAFKQKIEGMLGLKESKEGYEESELENLWSAAHMYVKDNKLTDKDSFELRKDKGLKSIVLKFVNRLKDYNELSSVEEAQDLLLKGLAKFSLGSRNLELKFAIQSILEDDLQQMEESFREDVWQPKEVKKARVEIEKHPDEVADLDDEQVKKIKDAFSKAGKKDPMKEKVKELWLKGKSAKEIEQILGIKLDLTNVELGSAHRDMMDGAFEIIKENAEVSEDKRVQVKKDGKWEWLFARGEDNKPVITKNKIKALKGQDALKYCQSKMGNDEFRLADSLEEALKVKRLKRMSPAQRAAARRAYRGKKLKISRILKKKRKKPAYKKHAKKLKKLKHGRSAGLHKKFMIAGLERFSNLLESLRSPALMESVLSFPEMVESLQYLDQLSDEMLVKYSFIAEAELKHVGLEDAEDFGEEPESEDDLAYVGQDDVEEEDEDLDDEYDDLAHVGDDWDALDDFDEEGDEVEDEYEDDKDYVEAKEEIKSLNNLKEDIDILSTKLKAHTISPSVAQQVFSDMLKYVAGSVETMVKLASAKNNQYVGEDEPEEENEKLDLDKKNKYVGDDAPESEEGKPEKAKANKYVGQDAPSEDDEKLEDPKKNKYVGDDKPEAEAGKPEKAKVNEYVGKDKVEQIKESEENSFEKLVNKLTQIGGLYDIGLAIKGEKNKSSSDRLAEYIEMKFGKKVVDELAKMKHADLRAVLNKYDIAEIK